MKTSFLSLIFIFISTSLFAQGSGFEVLGIAPTPYSLSKAEATTSIADGAASMFSNPALLVYNETSSIDLGYSFWVANVTNIFGGVNFRDGRRAIAFSFYTSGADDYEQRNGPGPSNGTFSIQYVSIAAAYARDFTYFSLGGTFQYLNEENFTYRANGYAFNFGIASRFLDERLRAGASVSNLGEMEKLNVEATPLPTNFKIGTSADLYEFTPPKNDDLPIMISVYADYLYPLQETEGKDYTDYIASEPYFSLGLGFNIAEVVELSAGYKFQPDDIVNLILERTFSGYTERPISFGVGFNTDEFTFNYALIPFNTGYGTVHSIGIQYKF